MLEGQLLGQALAVVLALDKSQLELVLGLVLVLAQALALAQLQPSINDRECRAHYTRFHSCIHSF